MSEQLATRADGDTLITREVIGGYLMAAAEEMHATVIRTAYSLNVKERLDCSSSILDASGQVVALAVHAPIHLGSMLGLVHEILRLHSVRDIHPRDVFLTNDPYFGGGSHLADITVTTPVFAEGRLIAFVANIAHHADLGGASPGGVSLGHTEIYQEGLRLPLMKLCDGGRLRPDIIDLISLNSRAPADRVGDMNAQVASLNAGARRVEELVGKYGASEVEASLTELLDYSERRIRARLRQLPDGGRSAADVLDPPQLGGSEVPLRVSVEVSGDRLLLDFSESGDQVQVPRNVPRTALLATVYTVVKQMLDPGLPANAGYFRAIDVTSRPGSILDPLSPAPVGHRALTCNIVGDVITTALSGLCPESAMAGSGAFLTSVVAGIDPRTQQTFVNFEGITGSMGAAVDRDGLDAVRVHASGGANQSVEAMELAFPVEVQEYGFITDSGGVGQFRGGLATRRDLRAFGSNLRVTLQGGRLSAAPPGAGGGGDGTCGRFILNPETEKQQALGNAAVRVNIDAGDLVRIETPSGGGYGESARRDPAAVERDVREGRVSAEQAESVYGVKVARQPTP